MIKGGGFRGHNSLREEFINFGKVPFSTLKKSNYVKNYEQAK